MEHHAGDSKVPPMKNIYPDFEKPVLVEDTGSYPTLLGSEFPNNNIDPLPEDEKVKVVQHKEGTRRADESDVDRKHDFDTYDFSDSQESYGMNDIDKGTQSV